VNWDQDELGTVLTDFVTRLTHIRRQYPVLRQSRFLTAQWNEELGVKDATWLTPAGDEMSPDHWTDGNARCVGLLLDGRAQQSGIPQRGGEATLLLIVNAHHDVVVFKLPDVPGGRDWIRLIDTNLPQEDEDPEDPSRFAIGHEYEVTGRSLLLYLLRPARKGRAGGESN
jgi:glycogen operon protein